MEERRETNFLSEPGKASGQSSLAIKSEALSVLHGRVSYRLQLALPFRLPIPHPLLTWKHQTTDVFFEFSQYGFYIKSEFYHLKNSMPNATEWYPKCQHAES